MQEPFFLGFLSVVVAFAAIYAAAAFVFAMQMPRFASLRWIGTAYAAYAAAFSCFTSTATGLIVAGNVLWVAGVAAFAQGLVGLLQAPAARIRRAQVASLLLVTVYATLSAATPDRHDVLLIVCETATLLLFATAAYEIHTRARRPLRLSWRVVLWLNVLMVLDAAVSSVLIGIEVYDPGVSFKTFSNVSFALLVVGFLIINSFAVIWLAAEALAEDLREQATRDPLTGILNRREMVEILGREVARAVRRGGSLAAVMVDLDHFKAINDTHGHGVGDQVLVEVAAVLKEQKRGSDHLFRYGGEEFLLLLGDTGGAAAGAVAERLLETLRERRFVPGLELAMTASVGVAALDPSDVSGAGLLRAADEALYQAKRAGRDRVESAEDEPASGVDGGIQSGQ